MSFSLRAKTLSMALLLLVAAGALFALQRPGRAEAHPLGNFTINHYSRIELSTAGIHVRYVIDMAEIPTYQEQDAIDANGDGNLARTEQNAYVQRQAEDLKKGLDLEISGARIDLQTASSALSFLIGQGGLDTQRMVFDYTAPLPGGRQSSAQQVEYHDKNYSERIGWREIVVRPLADVTLPSSDVPETDISNELLAYPANSIANPLNVTSAKFDFSAAVPGSTGGTTAPLTSAHPSTQARATQGNPDSTLGRFANLIAKDRLSVDVIIVALLAAIGFGALHALSPGHGKTIVGAYLVGSRGTWKHALFLALVVTVTHTSTVYALGFITLYLSSFIVPEKLYPWLSIASGGLVLAMGFALLVTRLRSSRLVADAWSWLRRALSIASSATRQLAFEHAGVDHAHDGQHDHDHPHTDHFHEHELAPMTHSHGFGGAHNHLPLDAEGRDLTWRGLIGLGVFGGLLPCPSAIVVMLSAIALHRLAFGLLLIVAFSFGLAGVLTSVGLLLVYAPALSRKLPFATAIGARLNGGGFGAFAVRALPAASAAAVVVAGAVLTAHGLVQRGLL